MYFINKDSFTVLVLNLIIEQVARTCCWWQDGGAAAIAVGGMGSQIQCWDTALAPISLAPVADHLPPSSVLDLSPYFRLVFFF